MSWPYHRTCLIIEHFEEGDDEYRERVMRLLESVNGENIKCDVFAVRDGLIKVDPDGHNVALGIPEVSKQYIMAVFVREPHTPPAPTPEDVQEAVEDLSAWSNAGS